MALELLVAALVVIVDSPHPAGCNAAAGCSVAHHLGKHIHRQILKAAVVCVVGICKKAELRGVGKSSCKCGPLIAFVGSVRAAYIAKPAVKDTALKTQIQNGFLLSVINSCKARLITLTVQKTNLLHNLCRYVFGGQRRVIHKEDLTVYHNLGNLLSVNSYLAVLNLCTRQFFNKVLQHIGLLRLKGVGVVLNGILLYKHLISNGANSYGIQHVV